MKKYWILGVLFVFAVVVSTIVIRTLIQKESLVLASEGQNASRSPQLQRTSPHPTENIKRPTEIPRRLPINEVTGKPAVSHITGAPLGERLIKEQGRIEFATPGGELKGKLTEIKLQRCELKSKEIVLRSNKLIETIENTEQKFTSISEGIKAYHIKRNEVLANYNSLVALIDSKKAAIGPLIEIVKSDVANFSCVGENPAGQLKKHKDDTQAVITALHEYRASIKNLILSITPTTLP